MPPSHHPHHLLIKTNIHLSTLQLIASLLLTLMLLWHISTITLVENYQMPGWWVHAFLAEHANAWRKGVWGLSCIVIPVDCLHALGMLDHWCGEMEGCRCCEDKDSRSSRVSMSQPRRSGLHEHAPHHPLLHPRFSRRTQILLLTAFDLLILALLAGHIATYFTSLQTAIAFCSLPGLLTAPAQPFGEGKVLLSVAERCVGLNVDIHVAGGFAVFMALVLGGLHGAVVVVRGWEWIVYGREGGSESGSQAGSGVERASERGCESAGGHSMEQAVAGSRGDSSIGAEERSTGIRCVNWSDERVERMTRRRAVRSDESDASQGVLKWGEVFLGCLVDA